MSASLPWERLQVGHRQLRKAFHAFDVNGDGTIQLDELTEVLRLLGMSGLSSNEIMARFKQADTDRSGGISFEEFEDFFTLVQEHVTCTHAQALVILRKAPHQRTPEELARLRNYLVTHQPFFRQFSRGMLAEVVRSVCVEDVPQGSWLWRIGDNADRACIILDGEATVWVQPPMLLGLSHQASLRKQASIKMSAGLRQLLGDPDDSDGEVEAALASAIGGAHHAQLGTSMQELGLSAHTSQRLRTRLSGLSASMRQRATSGGGSRSCSGAHGSPDRPGSVNDSQHLRSCSVSPGAGDSSPEGSLRQSGPKDTSPWKQLASEIRGGASVFPSEDGTGGVKFSAQGVRSPARAGSGRHLGSDGEGSRLQLGGVGGGSRRQLGGVGGGSRRLRVSAMVSSPGSRSMARGMSEEASRRSRSMARGGSEEAAGGRSEEAAVGRYEEAAGMGRSRSARLGRKSHSGSFGGGGAWGEGGPVRGGSMHQLGSADGGSAQNLGSDGGGSRRQLGGVGGGSSVDRGSKQKLGSVDGESTRKLGSAGGASRRQLSPDAAAAQAGGVSMARRCRSSLSGVDGSDGADTRGVRFVGRQGEGAPRSSRHPNLSGASAEPSALTALEGHTMAMGAKEPRGARGLSRRNSVAASALSRIGSMVTQAQLAMVVEIGAEGGGAMGDEQQDVGGQQGQQEGQLSLPPLAETDAPLLQLLREGAQQQQQQQQQQGQQDQQQQDKQDQHDQQQQAPPLARAPSTDLSQLNALLVPKLELLVLAQERSGSSSRPEPLDLDAAPLCDEVSESASSSSLHPSPSGKGACARFKGAANAVKFLNVVKFAHCDEVDAMAPLRRRGPTQADDAIRTAARLSGDVNEIEENDHRMVEVWCEMLDAEAQLRSQGADGGPVSPERQPPWMPGAHRAAKEILLGFMHGEGVLGERCLVPPSVTAAAAATAAAAGNDQVPELGAEAVAEWAGAARATAVLAASPMTVLVLRRDAFVKALAACDGMPPYTASHLLDCAWKPPRRRSAPEVAKLVYYLAGLPNFRDAPLSMHMALARVVEPENLDAGAVLLEPHVLVNHMYLVVEGSVGVFQPDRSSAPPGADSASGSWQMGKTQVAGALDGVSAALRARHAQARNARGNSAGPSHSKAGALSSPHVPASALASYHGSGTPTARVSTRGTARTQTVSFSGRRSASPSMGRTAGPRSPGSRSRLASTAGQPPSSYHSQPPSPFRMSGHGRSPLANRPMSPSRMAIGSSSDGRGVSLSPPRMATGDGRRMSHSPPRMATGDGHGMSHSLSRMAASSGDGHGVSHSPSRMAARFSGDGDGVSHSLSRMAAGSSGDDRGVSFVPPPPPLLHLPLSRPGLRRNLSKAARASDGGSGGSSATQGRLERSVTRGPRPRALSSTQTMGSSGRWGAPTAECVNNALMLANMLTGRDLMSEIEGATVVLDDAVGDMVQHVSPGRALGELELLAGLQGQSAWCTTVSVALQKTAVLRVSDEAYRSILHAYRSKHLHEQVAFFKAMSVCSRMRTSEVMAMSSAVAWVKVVRGTMLQEAGQPLQGLYFIRSGQVAVLQPTAAPHAAGVLSTVTRQVAVLGTGDHFGEDALTCNGVHEVTVVADAESVVGWLRPTNMGLMKQAGILNLVKSSRMRATWRAKVAASADSTRAMLGMGNSRAGLGAGPTRQTQSEHREKPVGGAPRLDMSIYEAWLRPLEAMVVRRTEAARHEAQLAITIKAEFAAVAVAVAVAQAGDPGGGAPTDTTGGAECAAVSGAVDTGATSSNLHGAFISAATSSSLHGAVRSRATSSIHCDSGQGAPEAAARFGAPLEWPSVEQQASDVRTLELLDLDEEVLAAAAAEKQAQEAPAVTKEEQEARRRTAAAEAGISMSQRVSFNASSRPNTAPSSRAGTAPSTPSKRSTSHALSVLSPTPLDRRGSSTVEFVPPSRPLAAAPHATAVSGTYTASSRKKYKYSGWRPAAAARPEPHDGLAFGQGGPVSRHMTSSTSALALASSFVPSIKVHRCTGHQASPRLLPSSPAAQDPLVPSPRSSVAALFVPRSEAYMRTAHAGCPVKSPPGPNPAGSLVTGMHYSGADVTSYKWRELHSEVPQQAAFMNRVDILKVAYYNMT